MIESLLVANRGEIACRIFRTARRLGIRTIAVYSDADATARHVREADEAVRIGPPAARDSYLDMARIIAAARESHATAIHPGYGFLSENARFAQACADAGILFVGPPAAAIAAMGSKIVAKGRMRAAGVPVLPGYEGERQDLAHLEAEARGLGLPLIIKPAAGGGGKGMRIVHQEAELPEALAAARRMAESAFGDSALLLERFLPAPRHVEVQVFADAHGNIVHLGDRDCSIQRRHQKLIEEAPAPDLPDELRGRLRAAAIVVAREIGYTSAGTVEFLFDGREFYFMEMNTRLQVEHTVTEAITGLDLVEWQLRVADGERLPLTQDDIRFNGHAIEARVCAEDPQRGFLPSAGHLRDLEWPHGDSIRVDAGFATADDVPDTYDSLLGKVIAWGATRDQAAQQLAIALDHTYSVGVHTNERWLARILRSRPFLDVRHSIAFLEQRGRELEDVAAVDRQALYLAALAAHLGPRDLAPDAVDTHDPWAARDGFAPNSRATVLLNLGWQGESRTVEIEFEQQRPVGLRFDREAAVAVTGLSFAGADVTALIAGRRVRGHYVMAGEQLHLWTGSRHDVFVLDDPRTARFDTHVARGGLTTPLPGVVVAVAVEEGAKVEAGAKLMVIEAMKMEHTITAPYSGTVGVVHYKSGDRVAEGSALLELTAS
ncbi:MAG TPA: biotin carboxylase N-terminal domain-containing protein [Steroidobacteraceae bacterium]|nr:biotin carboxylase N-terminal domain-containing protein [Steroidobacteraceae bacterium]